MQHQLAQEEKLRRDNEQLERVIAKAQQPKVKPVVKSVSTDFLSHFWPIFQLKFYGSLSGQQLARRHSRPLRVPHLHVQEGWRRLRGQTAVGRGGAEEIRWQRHLTTMSSRSFTNLIFYFRTPEEDGSAAAVPKAAEAASARAGGQAEAGEDAAGEAQASAKKGALISLRGLT